MAYMICKHGHAGGRNLFEILYQKSIPHLDYNLQRILIECMIYDSEIEQDHMDRARQQAETGNKDSKYIVRPKIGVREYLFAKWLQDKYPDWVNVDVTLLTTKEFLKIGQSANNYRNAPRASIS